MLSRGPQLALYFFLQTHMEVMEVTRHRYGSDLFREMRSSNLCRTFPICTQVVPLVETSHFPQHGVIERRFLTLQCVVCSFHEHNGTSGACGATT